MFKTVTLTAAIENLPGLFGRTFTCTGSTVVGGETITCPSAHGTMDIGGAFANSCNGVFAQLAAELGADTMTGYVEQAGLLSRYSVDGIQTAQGSYNLTGATQGQLGWSGVGQYNDLVNPCAMMVWMGAVANGGKAAVPHLIQEVDGAPALPPLRKGDGDPDPVRHGPDPGRHDGPERGPDLRLRPVPQHGHLRQVGHRRGGGR